MDGSGADNLTIAAVCAVGRGLDGPLLLVPVYIFLRRRLALFLHTSLLRTPHTGIITKTVVAAQVLARKITSLSRISLRLQADRYCKCKFGAPVRPLSVKLQQIHNALCKSYDETCLSPARASLFTLKNYSLHGREKVKFLSFWPP